MSQLTGKQRKRLRGLGQRLSPAVNVGKGGISPGVTAEIRALLGRSELVKVRLPQSQTGRARQAFADALAQSAGAECAGLVGRTALLYRANPLLPEDRRLRLD